MTLVYDGRKEREHGKEKVVLETLAPLENADHAVVDTIAHTLREKPDDMYPLIRRINHSVRMRNVDRRDNIAARVKLYTGALERCKKKIEEGVPEREAFAELLTCTDIDGKKTRMPGYFLLPDPYDPEGARNVPLIAFLTSGCMVEKKDGGCVYCAFPIGDTKIGHEYLRPQIDWAFAVADYYNTHDGAGNKKEYDVLKYNINAAGSMFDPAEVPNESFEYILACLHERQQLNPDKKMKFICESLPRFMDNGRMHRIREVLGNEVEVEVGYGFESGNDWIRKAIINKPIPLDMEDRIDSLKEQGARISGHVMMGLPFLSEEESIEDAVSSIKEITRPREGHHPLCDHALLLITNVKPATTVGVLHEKGAYTTPSLWSVAEVIRRLGPSYVDAFQVFGFEVADTKKVRAFSGDGAPGEEALRSVLREWRGRQSDFDALLAVFNDPRFSEEKRSWEQLRMQTPQSDLAHRAAEGYVRLLKTLAIESGESHFDAEKTFAEIMKRAGKGAHSAIDARAITKS